MVDVAIMLVLRVTCGWMVDGALRERVWVYILQPSNKGITEKKVNIDIFIASSPHAYSTKNISWQHLTDLDTAEQVMRTRGRSWLIWTLWVDIKFSKLTCEDFRNCKRNIQRFTFLSLYFCFHIHLSSSISLSVCLSVTEPPRTFARNASISRS